MAKLDMGKWLRAALSTAGLSQAEASRLLHQRFNWPDDRSVVNKIATNRRALNVKEALELSALTGADVPAEFLEAHHVSPLARIGKIPSNVISLSADEHASFRKERPEEEQNPIQEFRRVEIPKGSFIQVKGKVAASSWMSVDEMDFSYDDIELIPALGGYPASMQYGLKVEGNCLNKVAQHGDLLVCLDISSAPSITNNDLVIVERRRYGGLEIERTAKRVRKVERGFELWPESTDPNHQDPIKLNSANFGEDIHIIAKVLWIMKKP